MSLLIATTVVRSSSRGYTERTHAQIHLSLYRAPRKERSRINVDMAEKKGNSHGIQGTGLGRAGLIWQEVSHWLVVSSLKSEGELVEGTAWNPELFFLLLSSQRTSGVGVTEPRGAWINQPNQSRSPGRLWGAGRQIWTQVFGE